MTIQVCILGEHGILDNTLAFVNRRYTSMSHIQGPLPNPAPPQGHRAARVCKRLQSQLVPCALEGTSCDWELPARTSQRNIQYPPNREATFPFPAEVPLLGVEAFLRKTAREESLSLHPTTQRPSRNNAPPLRQHGSSADSCAPCTMLRLRRLARKCPHAGTRTPASSIASLGAELAHLSLHLRAAWRSADNPPEQKIRPAPP